MTITDSAPRTQGWAETDCSLHWRIDGDTGPVVLMLHEMGGSLHSFDAITDLLRPTCRVLRMDLRGFGFSEKPRAEYPFASLAGDVVAVLDAAGVVEPVLIVAVAGACPIAVDCALRHPHRVAGLLLCAPSLALSAEVRAATLARAEALAQQDLRPGLNYAMDALYPEPLRGPEFAAYRARYLACDPLSLAHSMRAFATHDVDLGAVAQPVRLLAGRHDLRPPQAVEATAAQFRAAQFHLVEQAGHAFATQAPGALAAHVGELLSQIKL